MKKIIVWSGIVLLMFLLVDIGRAGLIDYERLNNKRRGDKGAAAPRLGVTKPVAPVGPVWAIQTPKAMAVIEKRYDTNRDGLLQTSEIKIFLRYVITIVEEKGGYTVDSDILKSYDKNRDGVINRYELAEVKADAVS
ncbi:MAG: hypothetical protein A3D10_07085 [Omnitrophica WOR_2 bacterium RIFCSPHIGHO2_02_FULL_48_11]|nr:MAG: hypothetical protein A3D10_07085 [Omnitrophica WOR_2 bacterium RIFCSPHIGHO2_02_FULL_48_11]